MSSNDNIFSPEVAAVEEKDDVEIIAAGKSAAADNINVKGIKKYLYITYIYLCLTIFIIHIYNRNVTTVNFKDKPTTKRVQI